MPGADVEYLTVAEYAKRYKVSERTVRRCLKNGIIAYEQPGGKRGFIRIRNIPPSPQAESMEAAALPRNTRRLGRRPKWLG
jgi:excisionase family DNA binding protein